MVVAIDRDQEKQVISLFFYFRYNPIWWGVILAKISINVKIKMYKNANSKCTILANHFWIEYTLFGSDKNELQKRHLWEGEVYAYSSAFTAIVFWLILKWEDHADEPHSDRWLILITYMTGLSIGVHLLNLLCIPAIVLVYCYRKFPKMELKGSLIALVISFVIIAAVLYGIVPGIITVGGWFELFFVNILGCPFNTGEIVYIILLVATVVWAIYESYSETNEKLFKK